MRAAFYIIVDDKYLGLGVALARRLAGLWRLDAHVFLENGGAREEAMRGDDQVFLHRNLLQGMRPEGLPSTHNWPAIVYDRIFAPGLLTQYERLIYLDADIYPTVAAPELLNVPLPTGLAAVHDTAAVGASPRAAGSDRDAWRQAIGLRSERYFNSGMLLIDPKIWAGTDFIGAMRDFFGRFGAGVHMPDQDFLNHHFQDRWTELSPRFNFQKALFNYGYEAVFDPVFIHFSSFQKPWLKPDCAESPHGQFYPVYQRMMSEAEVDPQAYRGARRDSALRRLRRHIRSGLSDLGLRTGKERRQAAEWQRRAVALCEGFRLDAAAGRYADLDFAVTDMPRPRLSFDGQYLRRPLDVPI